MRLIYTLLVGFIGCNCFAQHHAKLLSGRGSAAILLTQTTISEQESPDTTRLLYASNNKGDSLALYALSDGVVQSYLIYARPYAGNSLVLVFNQADSLTMHFNDAVNEVRIGNDVYVLYPQYYQQFKQAVLTDHSVLDALRLLQDQIGDYPVENLLPLLQFTAAPVAKSIRKATIETHRSQADDVKDVWLCTYSYDKSGKLLSVLAASGKVVRFEKKIVYRGAEVSAVKLYRNIEERQITNRTVVYPGNNKSLVKWEDVILETGKNRQTTLKITLQKKTRAPLKNIIMQPAGVINLIQQKATYK